MPLLQANFESVEMTCATFDNALLAETNFKVDAEIGSRSLADLFETLSRDFIRDLSFETSFEVSLDHVSTQP